MKQKESRINPLLPPERTALSQPRLSSGWLAQDGRARAADDDGLGVGEDGGDVETSWALDVHEERAWGWDKCLQLMLLCLSNWVGVEEIFCEHHLDKLPYQLRFPFFSFFFFFCFGEKDERERERERDHEAAAFVDVV